MVWIGLVLLAGVCLVLGKSPAHPRWQYNTIHHGSHRQTRQVSSCGIVDRNVPVQLISPLLHSWGYPDNLDCKWTISTTPGNRLQLMSVFFFLENSTNCLYDYLEIRDGDDTESSSIGRFCGEQPLGYISDANTVHIRFHSDASLSGSGFNISVTDFKSSTESDSCYMMLQSSSGVITSPGFPDSYPSNVECFYRIQVPQGKKVMLSFDVFDLELMPCIYDFLEVYDGKSTADKKIGTFCGHTAPKYVSSSHDMFLRFKSDDFVERGGFNISYESVSSGVIVPQIATPSAEFDPECSALITTMGLNLTNPHFGTNEVYRKRMSCRTTLSVPHGQQVLLQFSRLELETSSECSFDHLAIKYSTQTGNRSVNLCGYHQPHTIEILSSDNYLQLDFKTDCSFENTGYMATYKFIPENERDSFAVLADDESDCLYTPCLNGGTCYNNGEGYHCACQTGFVPPNCTEHVAFVEKTSNCSVTIGSTVVLRCLVNHPHSIIVWDLNGTIQATDQQRYIQVDKGELHIGLATLSHQGPYTCDVLAAGTILTHTLWLTVLPPPDEDYEHCGLGALADPNTESDDTIRTHHPRIKGEKSHTVEKGDIPWQIFLWRKETSQIFCGGTLISSSWVLTAAHCISIFKARFQRPDFTTAVDVLAGTANCNKTGATTRQLESYKIHPQFDERKWSNDIALIKLKIGFNFSSSIRPVCLSSPNMLVQLAKPKTMVVVSGCGLNPSYRRSKTLRSVDIPIADYTTCRSHSGQQETYNNGTLCAGYPQSGWGDAAEGDSGGPLVVKHGDRWNLIGLVSYGNDTVGTYGYYANVSHFVHWIKPSMGICGSRPIEGNEDIDEIDTENQFRIVGGSEAVRGSFPWHAALAVKPRRRAASFVCGAVILNEYWLLTAKHCLIHKQPRYRKSELRIVVGAHSRTDKDWPREEFLVDKYIPAVRLSAKDQADLALIKIKPKTKIINRKRRKRKTGIQFSKFVQPICVPPSSLPIPANKRCIVAGWGKIDTGSYSVKLQSVALPLLDDATCGNHWNLTESLFCAGEVGKIGEKGKDSCLGDSGGGLVCNFGGKYILTGIVASGPSECGHLKPSLNTKVSFFSQWIRDTIA